MLLEYFFSRTLQDGHVSHHSLKNPMKFTIPNGLITRNDKETSDVLVEHFTKVFNRSAKVDMEHTKAIPRKNYFEEISGQMKFDESSDSLHKLTWHKVGGDNGVSPNALKVLNKNSRHKLL